MAYQFRPEVEDAIAKAAQKYGVPLDAMRAQAQLESGGNPLAQNSSSSAGGLYQFIDSTAKNYGLTDKFDPYQSSDAAARLMRDNYSGLSSALGRAPTTGELYLAHQQGLGGATKLLTNPNAPASSVVGSDAIRLNAGSPDMTAGQFAGLWVNKANNLAGDAGGIASLAPSQATAATVGATLPTVSEAAATDPMSGIFGALLQARMQEAAPAPVAAPAMRKAPDTRSDEEKLAAVSQTPNVYIDRMRRRANYG